MDHGNKTSLGLDENIEGLLCYVLGFITGIIFLVTEKESRFVKFHAVQSICMSVVYFGVFLALGIIAGIFSFIPFIGGILVRLINFVDLLVWLGILASTVFVAFKAYSKETYKLPIIGDIAEKQSYK